MTDAEALNGWISQGVARTDRHPDRIRAVLLEHCRDKHIAPPTPERITRIIGSATHRAQAKACATIAVGIPAATVTRILGLITAAGSTAAQPTPIHGSRARLDCVPLRRWLQSACTEHTRGNVHG